MSKGWSDKAQMPRRVKVARASSAADLIEKIGTKNSNVDAVITGRGGANGSTSTNAQEISKKTPVIILPEGGRRRFCTAKVTDRVTQTDVIVNILAVCIRLSTNATV